jgi:hypothetical protein
LVLIFIYWPFISMQRDFVYGDLSFIYQPVCKFIGSALQQGRIPLWNDSVYTGMPQIAVISPGIFYPPNLLLFLLPFSLAISLYMILHQLLFAFGVFCYLRTYRVSQIAASMVAFAAALSGYMFAMIKYPDYAGIAWIPCLAVLTRSYFSAVWMPETVHLGISSGAGNVADAEAGNVADAEAGNVADAEAGNVADAEAGNVADAEAGNVADAGAGNVADAEAGNLADAEAGNVADAEAGNVADAEAGNVADAGGGNVADAEAGNVADAGGGNVADSGLPNSKRAGLFALLIGLTSAMLVLSGRPENFIPGVILVSIQAACEIREAFKSKVFVLEILKYGAIWSVAIICGITMSSSIILPELEWLKLSHRGSGLIGSEIFSWSTTWYDWLSLVFWEPVGDTQLLSGASKLIQLLHKDQGHILPLCASFYMGACYCFAASIAIFAKRKQFVFICTLLILPFAIFCAGDQTPLAPAFFATFPKLAIIRYPVKLLVFPVLLSMPLAAAGIDALRSKTINEKKFYFLSFVTALLAVLCLIPNLNLAVHLLDWMQQVAGVSLPTSVFQETAGKVTQSLCTGLVLLFMFCAGYLLYLRGVLRENIFCLVLSLLVLMPLCMNAVEAGKRSTAQGFYDHEPRILSLLKNAEAQSTERGGRLSVFASEGFLKIPSSYFQDGKVPASVAGLSFLRDNLEFNGNMNTGVKCSSGYELAEIGSFSTLLVGAEYFSNEYNMGSSGAGRTRSDLPYARFCAISGADYVLTHTHRSAELPQKLLDEKLFEFVKEDEQTDTRIYRLRTPAQRFYFASALQAVKDGNDFLERVLRADSKFDANSAYVDSDSLRAIGALLRSESASNNGVAAARINLIERRPEYLNLAIQKKSPGLLVIRDQFYPGWKAWIDDREVSIFGVNQVNRGIVVPAGNHRVVLRYEPQSIRIALWLTVGGVIGLIGIVIMLLCFPLKGFQLRR